MARPDFTDGASAQKWLENEELRTRQRPSPAPTERNLGQFGSAVRPPPQRQSRREAELLAQSEFQRRKPQMQGLSPEAQYQVASLQEPLRSPLGAEAQALMQAEARAMQEQYMRMREEFERRAREDALRAQYMEPMDYQEEIGPWPAAGISGRRRRMTRVY